METLFQPFEPEGDGSKRRRFRPVPLRLLLPNLVTLLALCAGLTSIRMALEGRIELAVYAVVAAGVLDGLDGRLARLLKGTSRFGAELDSLADFVSFGVAPAVLLFVWTLDDLGSIGWIGALIFAIGAALRLARFNVTLDAPRPSYAQDFFTGVPAPAGAILVLLPVYLGQLAEAGFPIVGASVSWAYCVAMAGLMVSRLPTWSLKRTGSRVAREWVAPLFVLAILLIGLLVSYPWVLLALGSVAYLASLPFAWMRWRQLAGRHHRDKGAGVDTESPPATSRVPVEEMHSKAEPSIRLH